MRHIILFAFLFLLPAGAHALDMTSIQPSTASPGSIVTLTGGPFSQNTLVILGNIELTPANSNGGAIQVEIPEGLETGDYVIYLAEGAETSREAFILHLIEPRPVILEVVPAEVDICQPEGTPAQLRIEGNGFAPSAKALIDGAAVPLTSSGRGYIELNLPPLSGGSHRVKVVNPSGTESIPHNFVVNSRPEITQISEGDNQVNSYQLLISGRNFHPKLQLTVEGTIIRPVGTFNPPNNDTFEYLDCGSLVYTRYQVTGQLRRASFHILNPGGQQSPGFDATIR